MHILHASTLVGRNKDVVEKYVSEVIVAYANAFVTDVLHGACVRAAANELANDAARRAHEGACAKVREHNAKTAAAHAAEVQEKQCKEEQYVQVRPRCGEVLRVGTLKCGGQPIGPETPQG